MYSLIIKNANLIDGSASESKVCDVAVQGSEIVNIAENISQPAETTINASGKILAPGFIDLQNHSDSYWQIFDNPALHGSISQGFTTLVLGNCGASLAPLIGPNSLKAIQKWHALESVNLNWQSFGEFLDQLSNLKLSANVASMVGYSTLRRGLIGDEIRPLEEKELQTLKKLLKEAISQGAFGLSSGLSYAHEIGLSPLELIEMAKVVKEQKAMWSVHLRNEGTAILEAVDEILDLAQKSGVNLKIAHLKIKGEENWPHLPEILNKIETSYHRGAQVHFDLYPYDTTWIVLYSYLPKWATEGGREAILRNLANPVQKNKILAHLNNSGAKFSSMIVASTSNKLNFTGKSIGQIAKNMESSSEQAVLHLLEHGGTEIMVFDKNLSNDQVQKLALHPLSFIATDGAGFGINEKQRLVHPRCFGTAPKFLRLAKEHNLSLTEAIKKLTSGPAKKIGLKKRGEIKIGNFADMVIFDQQTIADKATFENPYQYSLGIEQVFVNGRPVYNKGEVTGELPGMVLKKT